MKRVLVSILFALLGLTSSARDVYSLRDGWQFYFKSENSSDNARYVSLPHSWNSDPMNSGVWLETTGNYYKSIFVPAQWRSKRLFLKFNGAQNVADIFVNGSHVGNHKGAGVAFTFEITDRVKFGANNTILAVVSNGYREDILPVSGAMNIYGGLYRDAELIVTEKSAISPLHLGTEGILIHQQDANTTQAKGEVEVHILTKGVGKAGSELRLDIVDSKGVVVYSKSAKHRGDGEGVVKIAYLVEKPKLWSPDSPSIYDFRVSLDDGAVRDMVTVSTGLRSVRVEARGGLLINGKEFDVKGVELHHDNAESGGVLLSEDYDTDLNIIADMGANALRSMVLPHSQCLYDRCDERGILVWVDVPLHRTNYLSDISYYPTEEFREGALSHLKQIVAQNINHPSVVMWGIFSRMWLRGDSPIELIKELNSTAKQMDASRPTVACSDQDGAINFITDLIVWRQDLGWSSGTTDDVVMWRNQLHSYWSHLRSAVSYGGEGQFGHQDGDMNPLMKSNWMPESRQRRHHEEYSKHLQNDSLLWGRWIGSAFDFGSHRSPYKIEASGAVTFDRRDRKDIFYLYRAMWNHHSPTLHIANKRGAVAANRAHFLTLYSSDGAPTIFMGRDTIGVTLYAPCQYRSDTIIVRDRVDIKVVTPHCRDSVTLIGSTASAPLLTPSLRQTADLQSLD